MENRENRLSQFEILKFYISLNFSDWTHLIFTNVVEDQVPRFPLTIPLKY